MYTLCIIFLLYLNLILSIEISSYKDLLFTSVTISSNDNNYNLLNIEYDKNIIIEYNQEYNDPNLFKNLPINISLIIIRITKMDIIH